MQKGVGPSDLLHAVAVFFSILGIKLPAAVRLFLSVCCFSQEYQTVVITTGKLQ